MAAPGHVPTFSTPVGHVLNAAESRPSGPSVGNLRINGPSLGRGGASALCHEKTFGAQRTATGNVSMQNAPDFIADIRKMPFTPVLHLSATPIKSRSGEIRREECGF